MRKLRYLSQRRTTKTVNVVNPTYTAGVFTNPAIYSGLTAIYEQTANAGQIYAVDEQGKMLETLDIFWFTPIIATGALPVITPKYRIVQGSNTYEVLSVSDQGGMGENLKVSCRIHTPKT